MLNGKIKMGKNDAMVVAKLNEKLIKFYVPEDVKQTAENYNHNSYKSCGDIIDEFETRVSAVVGGTFTDTKKHFTDSFITNTNITVIVSESGWIFAIFTMNLESPLKNGVSNKYGIQTILVSDRENRRNKLDFCVKEI